MAIRRATAYGVLLGATCMAAAQTTPSDSKVPRRSEPLTLPAGTPLPVALDGHAPLHVGQQLQTHLLYPLYLNNASVVPAGAIVLGTVVALDKDASHRKEARLRGDFTPFSKAAVRFDRLTLPDGSTVPIQTSSLNDGAPILRLLPPPPRKGGRLHQAIETGKQLARDRIAVVTGPEKRDRLTQFLYTQLPYHPQRLNGGTSWTAETTAPITLPADIVASAIPAPPPPQQSSTAPKGILKKAVAYTAPAPSPPTAPGTWMVEAYLDEPLTSDKATLGQSIHATIAQPVYNDDHTIAVPQGARLEGAVTQVKPARRFGHAGVLRFDFRELKLPEGGTTNVQTSVAAIDATNGQDLAIDSEGKVKPKPKDKVVVPLLLLALASSPLHQEHHEDGGIGKNAGASNSLGLVGFIVGVSANAPAFASGLGYYGAALALYNRWIKRGDEITFPKDTRIVIQTTPRRSAPMPSERTRVAANTSEPKSPKEP